MENNNHQLDAINQDVSKKLTQIEMGWVFDDILHQRITVVLRLQSNEFLPLKFYFKGEGEFRMFQDRRFENIVGRYMEFPLNIHGSAVEILNTLKPILLRLHSKGGIASGVIWKSN